MIFSVSICSVASRRDLVTRQMALGPRSRQMLDRGPTLTNEISARACQSGKQQPDVTSGATPVLRVTEQLIALQSFPETNIALSPDLSRVVFGEYLLNNTKVLLFSINLTG